MSDNRPAAALIGDIIHSRHHEDQTALFRALDRALDATNRELAAIQPLTMKDGDQFQGLFANLSLAIDATLRVRVHLQPAYGVRIGVGVGDHQQPLPERPTPQAQTGSAWWAADDALAFLAPPKTLATRKSRRRHPRRGWPSSLRTAVRIPRDPITEAIVTAHLLCRDALLDRWDDDDLRIFVALREGRTQTAIASALGRTQSTISSRVQHKGILAVLRAHESMLSTARDERSEA